MHLYRQADFRDWLLELSRTRLAPHPTTGVYNRPMF
jgi:hypothetical protein